MKKKLTFIPEEFHLPGVKRLQNNKIPLSAPKKKPKYKPVIEEVNHFHFSIDLTAAEVQSEEAISYQQAGLADKLLRKLRKGQYNAQRKLDLHGRTIAEAEQSLGVFLKNCIANDIKIILIVHGKGPIGTTPKLKNKINQWLRRHDDILAFCSALPRDGGAGAIYVMLKSKK